MYNFKRSLIALLGLLLLIGVVAAITPFKGYSQQSPEAVTATQDVRVVNTTAAPVQTKIINGITTPVLTKIINQATTPVQTRDIDEARAANNVTLEYDPQGHFFYRVLTNGTTTGNEFVVPTGQALIVTDVQYAGSCGGCSTGATSIMNLYLTPGNEYVYGAPNTVDSNQRVAGSENMRTGFAVGLGGRIRAFAFFVTFDQIFLHGYLVPAS